MNDLEQRLIRIESMVTHMYKVLQNKTSPAIENWLTEDQAMQILSLSKRTLADIRKSNQIRSSSATGRKFKYYKVDVERYLYDNSVINRRSLKK